MSKTRRRLSAAAKAAGKAARYRAALKRLDRIARKGGSFFVDGARIIREALSR